MSGREVIPLHVFIGTVILQDRELEADSPMPTNRKGKKD